MPEIAQRPLNPYGAPRRILRGDPNHEPPDLIEHAAASRPGWVRPFPCNQLSMPSQQRVGCHNRGHQPQPLTAQPECPGGQPPSVIIGESQPPSAKLPTEETVLFHQVNNRFPVAAFEPAGQHHQQQVEG